MRKKRIRHSREQIVGHMQNQRTTSPTQAPLARRGDEVGVLLAPLLFADRGLVLEVEEAIAPGPLQHFAAEWIPTRPNFGSVNGRQCDGLRGWDFGELFLDATKSPDPFVLHDVANMTSQTIQFHNRVPVPGHRRIYG